MRQIHGVPNDRESMTSRVLAALAAAAIHACNTTEPSQDSITATVDHSSYTPPAVVQQLQRLILQARAGGKGKVLEDCVAQLQVDGSVESGTVDCDGCGEILECPLGAKAVKCHACGKTTVVEW